MLQTASHMMGARAAAVSRCGIITLKNVCTWLDKSSTKKIFFSPILPFFINTLVRQEIISLVFEKKCFKRGAINTKNTCWLKRWVIKNTVQKLVLELYTGLLLHHLMFRWSPAVRISSSRWEQKMSLQGFFFFPMKLGKYKRIKTKQKKAQHSKHFWTKTTARFPMLLHKKRYLFSFFWNTYFMISATRCSSELCESAFQTSLAKNKNKCTASGQDERKNWT